jgi:hypothetical protein
MAKQKQKVELKNLGKQHTKDFLKKYHPFLKKEFRPLDKSELNSDEVFNELFPNEDKVELFKLRAIYEFQK